MTVGTGSWRPAVENAIPCVEIEQLWGGKRPKNILKKCFCKVSLKKAQSPKNGGQQVSSGDSQKQVEKGRKEGVVDTGEGC